MNLNATSPTHAEILTAIDELVAAKYATHGQVRGNGAWNDLIATVKEKKRSIVALLDRIENSPAIVEPPTCTFTATPVTPSADTTPTVSFESDDETATFEAKIDSGAWAVAESPLTLAAQAVGVHTLYVRAVATGSASPVGQYKTAVPAQWTFEVTE